MVYDISFSQSELSHVTDIKEAIISKMHEAFAGKYDDALKLLYFANRKLVIRKKSIDARHNKEIAIIFRFELLTDKDILDEEESCTALSVPYLSQAEKLTDIKRPVIVGFGPAGMYAALVLSRCGLKPIILERGSSMDKRVQDVRNYMEGKTKIVPNSNIQFGEGGAGTFSDGKLTTGVSSDLKKFITNSFIEFGAPDSISYESTPHIGTDKLREVVVNLRKEVVSLGATILFESNMTEILKDNGRVVGVSYEKDGTISTIDTDRVILAIGHSSRDTFKYIYESKIDIEAKPFSVGVRIEHLQATIDKAQYGFNTKYNKQISAANYKLAVNCSTNRKLYSFCMCPGGQVVPASNIEGNLCTNGMSNYAREQDNANAALLVPVDSKDYGDEPLSGVYFQEKLEKAAFVAGGGNGYAPVVRYEDLVHGKVSSAIGRVTPSYKPGYSFADFSSILPKVVIDTIVEGVSLMNSKVKGFNDPDAILTAVESRSSSPVRITRIPESLQSTNLAGLFPCGEGAGYAGGIMSSAIDGINCANALIKSLLEENK